jgi:pantetheine-phosphate adenylyltransferase
MTQKIAVCSGSYDLLTNGHAWVITTASKLVDVLYVGVGTNPGKQYMFTMDERINMIEDIFVGKKSNSGNIIVKPFTHKYLMKFVDEVGANYIIRGIRGVDDYNYERGMMDINNDLFGPGIETIFLMPPRELQGVSSSMVKGLIAYEGWEEVIAKYVPPNVKESVIKKVNENADRKSS